MNNKYIDHIRSFFSNKKHIEAIVLAAVIVVIVALLAANTGGGKSGDSASATGDAASKSFFGVSKSDNAGGKSGDSKDSDAYKKEEKGSDLHDLLAEYYKDYAAGKTDDIEKVASPVSDMEKSYIRFMSKLLKSYDIKEVYTKDGAENGAKLVSVYVQMHFKGLKSAAPGLDFFYVEKDSSGNLHINNLYSSFNQTNKENAMDPSVVSSIASFEEQKDVVDLQTKVQKEYNEISLSDKDFTEFMSKTYPAQVKKWQAKYRKKAKAAEKKQKEEEKKKQKKEEKKKEKEEKKKEKEEKEKKEQEEKKKKQEEEKKKAEEKKTEKKSESKSSKDTYKTTTETNLRKKDTIESDIIKTLKKGTKVTKKGSKGKWLKVSYKGKTGYIRKEYLKKENSSSSSDSKSSSSSSDKPKEGKKLLLKDTVNVRKKPSTSSDRINLAYEGEKILVIENRDDGWTKVQYKNKKGYVKTELLK